MNWENELPNSESFRELKASMLFFLLPIYKHSYLILSMSRTERTALSYLIKTVFSFQTIPARCSHEKKNLTTYKMSHLLLQTSREQLPVAWFARSLLVIPKTLAVNAALDSTDLVAKLRAFHNASQTMGEREDLKWWVQFVVEREGRGQSVKDTLRNCVSLSLSVFFMWCSFNLAAPISIFIASLTTPFSLLFLPDSRFGSVSQSVCGY